MKDLLSKASDLRIQHLHLVLAVQLIVGGMPGSAATFQWAKVVTPGTGEYQVKALTSDAQGHAVVASQRWIRNDSGIVASTWLSNRVTKVDSAGNILWTYDLLPNIGRAWTMGGLATDAVGRTYVAGSLCRGFRFPFQPLIPQDYLARVGITTDGSGGGYVARLSPSGELEWFRCFGGARAIQSQRIAVDAEGNYYVAGAYSATAIQIDDIQLPAPVPTTGRNLFLVKFSPDGRAQWAKAAVGVASHGDFEHILIDEDQRVRATLWKGDPELPCRVDGVEVSPEHAQVEFDRDGTVIAIEPVAHSRYPRQEDGSFFGTSASELALTKYRADGEIEWEWGPESPTIRADWRSVAVDADGNQVLAGTFHPQSWPEAASLPSGELILGETTLTTVAASELMLAKVSREGDLQWAMQSEGQHSDYDFWVAYNRGNVLLTSSTGVDGVIIAPDGAIWVTGGVKGSVRFGGHPIEGPQNRYSGLIQTETRQAIYLARLVEPSTLRPSLRLDRFGNPLRFRWPASFDGFVLESTPAMSGAGWDPVNATSILDGDEQVVTVETGGASGFYRLRRP
jgi:hypothetical protein